MYLHLGQDVVVLLKNVIAIFDLENTSISKITKEFLTTAEEEGFIENISEDLPKSFVVCEVDGNSKIYISPISSVTLYKRAGYVDTLSKEEVK